MFCAFSSDCFVAPVAEASSFVLAEGGTSVPDEDCLPGVLDFRRGPARKPSARANDFLPGDTVCALNRAATLLSGLPGGVVVRNATGLRPLVEGVLDPSGLRLSRLCAPVPADFGRGRRLGLNRARLAFVGDRKDARLGMVCRPSRVTGRSREVEAWIAADAGSDSLRRFEGELSIVESAYYAAVIKTSRIVYAS